MQHGVGRTAGGGNMQNSVGQRSLVEKVGKPQVLPHQLDRALAHIARLADFGRLAEQHGGGTEGGNAAGLQERAHRICCAIHRASTG